MCFLPETNGLTPVFVHLHHTVRYNLAQTWPYFQSKIWYNKTIQHITVLVHVLLDCILCLYILIIGNLNLIYIYIIINDISKTCEST